MIHILIIKKRYTIMKQILHMVILMAPVLTALPPVSIAHGISAGHVLPWTLTLMIVTMIATAPQAFTFVRHTALMASAITMQTIAILPQPSRWPRLRSRSRIPLGS